MVQYLVRSWVSRRPADVRTQLTVFCHTGRSLGGYGAAVVDNDYASGMWEVERITDEFHYMCKKAQGNRLTYRLNININVAVTRTS